MGWTGVGASVLLSVAAFFLTPLGFLDSVYLMFLCVALPALSFAQLPLLESVVVARIPAYVGSAGSILVLGSVALLLGLRGLGVETMGLGSVDGVTLSLWTVGLIGLALAILLVFYWGGRALRVRESPVLRELLPRTAGEKGVFLFLSLCAGVGEELAFRGYAVPTVSRLVGSDLLALAITCVPFGLVHVYQGGVGVVRSYVLGLALGVSFLITGSLWPAMLAHAGIDILGGLFLGDRLLGPAGSDGHR
jgi:membrane protease YdiL (CAAX protease family)